MKNLSMSAAIATVNKSHGKPIRQSGTSYVAFVPYHTEKQDGPTTEIRADSRDALLARLRYRKAHDALWLMGHDANAMDYEIDELAREGCSVREIIKKLAYV